MPSGSNENTSLVTDGAAPDTWTRQPKQGTKAEKSRKLAASTVRMIFGDLFDERVFNSIKDDSGMITLDQLREMFFGPLIAAKANENERDARLQASEDRLRLLEAENEALVLENKLLRSQSASLSDRSRLEMSSVVAQGAPITHDLNASGVAELPPLSEQTTFNLPSASQEGAQKATPGLKAAIESSDDHGTGFDPAVLRRDPEKKLVPLMAGDLIWLRSEDKSSSGTVLGEMGLRACGVDPSASAAPGGRLTDGVFRLCLKLNYRAKSDLNKVNKLIKVSDDPETAKKSLAFDLLTKRVLSEAAQNAEVLSELEQGKCDTPIRYGDTVQLQHLNSGHFLAMHKSPALHNHNCRKVSLKQGALSAQFQIMPRFKVRSVGSLVYALDQVVLHSVKYDTLVLGTSPINDPVPSDHPSYNLRMPSVLRGKLRGEVNGSIELRFFTINLFLSASVLNSGRAESGTKLLTGVHMFTLFHPEANSVLQASSDCDKGEVLDALGSDDDPVQFERLGGLPMHVPFLKLLSIVDDESVGKSAIVNPSAKSCWTFEPLDPSTSSEVQWSTMPLRIRHVASGKYLSVNSLQPSPVTSTTIQHSEFIPNDDDGGARLRASSLQRSDTVEKSRTLYNASLCDIFLGVLPGAFGSEGSTVFYLSPTDVTGKFLNSASSSLRLEHRAPDGQVLYFASSELAKPACATMSPVSTKSNKGSLIFFSTVPADLDVLKLQIVRNNFPRQLLLFLSYRKLFRQYAHQYQCAVDPLWEKKYLPADNLYERVAFQCLELLDDLRKRPPPRRHDGNVVETLREANSVNPTVFRTFFTGDSDPQAQVLAFETKLVDSVFEAAIAPYNYASEVSCMPFEGQNESATAVQKLLYVTMQMCINSNYSAQSYFVKSRSRVWTARSVTDETVDQSKVSKEQLRKVSSKRSTELWRDILISQGAETLGAIVTLEKLLLSSKRVVQKLVNNDLLDRCKSLITKCGPELRLMSLFIAACKVEGEPSTPNQEMNVRKLWMNVKDRYAFGVTMQEVPRTAQSPKYGPVFETNGCQVPYSRVQVPADAAAPTNFLGKSPKNQYSPVCVAWTGSPKWEGGCNSLWWSASSLNLPVVGTREETPKTGPTFKVDLVPIEALMWVLEPWRLCFAVTGVQWRPFDDSKKRKISEKGGFNLALLEKVKETNRRLLFQRQHQLAAYVVAQFELLAKVCEGRSYNCIAWLQQSFSYTLLMNLASNSHLPLSFRAAAISLVITLYVDRFPQFPNGGAPFLPEHLWIYRDDSLGSGKSARNSSTPIIRALEPTDGTAFASFFVPALCSAKNHPDPVLSYPDHFKFFLLQKVCIGTINSFGEYASRIIHSERSLTDAAVSAVTSQKSLLHFGFLSNYDTLKELCMSNCRLFDGRSDLPQVGKNFTHERDRFDLENAREVGILKRNLVATLSMVDDIRVNYLLGQLLQIFKTKANLVPDIQMLLTELAAAEHRSKYHYRNEDITPEVISAKDYLLQATREAVLDLARDFDSLCPGGSHGAAKLDLAALSEKPDLDHALIDSLMYNDDDLFAASLGLLASNYQLRQRLQSALQNVMLLDVINLPVYGDIHGLRADLNELELLTRTSNVWGVKSLLSGPFGDKEFGAIMAIIDQLLLFLHTPADSTGTTTMIQFLDASEKEKGSAFQGYFEENDLQGNYYQSDHLWSLDVAQKWAARFQSKRYPIDRKHQDILRGLNVAPLLNLAVVLDAEIAWKGSICTVREKAESQRRLTLVKRALLCLCIAFVEGNAPNQDILFQSIRKIESIAYPSDQGESVDGLDTRPPVIPAFDQKGTQQHDATNKDSAEPAWPFTICELGQCLAITLFRGNAGLAERASPSLVSLFARVASMSKDPSSSPALELLFALARPEGSTPNKKFQLLIAHHLVIPAGPDNSGLRLCTCHCLGEAAKTAFKSLVSGVSKRATESTLRPTASSVSKADAALDAARTVDWTGTLDYRSLENRLENPGTSIILAKQPKKPMGDPARMIRLLSAVIESGNEAASIKLRQAAGITLDATCETIVGHLEASADELKEQRNYSWLTVDGSRLNSVGVLNIMSSPESVGGALLLLFVEQMFVQPLNGEQILSKSLWRFIEFAVVPMLFEIRGMDELSTSVAKAFEDIVDCLEKITRTLVRLGLLQTAINDSAKGDVLLEVARNLSIISSMRAKPPEAIVEAFLSECAKNGTDCLSKEHFVALTEKLNSPDIPDEERVVTPMRYKYLMEVFEAADDDNSGTVDLYEFIALFTSLSSMTSDGDATGNQSLIKGHKLNVRTVESIDRIVATTEGQGSSLGAPRFNRIEVGQKRKLEQNRKSSLKWLCSALDPSVMEPRENLLPPMRKGVSNLQRLFVCFQRAVLSNPMIKASVVRRRFELVDKLERGTPGPPPGVGRKLIDTKLSKARTKNKESIRGLKTSKVSPETFKDLPQRGSDLRRRSANTYDKFAEERAIMIVQNQFRCWKARSEFRVRLNSTKNMRSKHSNPLSGAVELSWKDITERCVEYVSSHFRECGKVNIKSTILTIFELWMVHLLKARSRFVNSFGQALTSEKLSDMYTIELIPVFDLNEEERVIYAAKQTAMSDLGVATLLIRIIQSLQGDLSVGGLPDAAIDLFEEMLNGGNKLVQDRLLHFLLQSDVENCVLEHLNRRLGDLRDALATARANGDKPTQFALGGAKDSDELKEACERGAITLRFLQLLCEGHHTGFQNYLRSQPHARREHNLVDKCTQLLVFMCDSIRSVEKLSGVELTFLAQLISTLVEAMTGPCSANQDLVVNSDVVVAVNYMLAGTNPSDLELMSNRFDYKGLRGNACTLLAACLEGRDNSTAHNILRQRIEYGPLSLYQEELERMIRKSVKKPKSQNRLPTEAEKDSILSSLLSLGSVSMVLIELNMTGVEISDDSPEGDRGNVFASGIRQLVGGIGALSNGLGQRFQSLPRMPTLPSLPQGFRPFNKRSIDTDDADDDDREQYPLTAVVEVLWRGQCQRICFPLPLEIAYFTEKNKKNFLAKVNLSTTDKRMKELVRATELFMTEMEQIYNTAERSPWFRWVHQHVTEINYFVYLLVVVLNFNVLLSPPVLNPPGESLIRLFFQGSENSRRIFESPIVSNITDELNPFKGNDAAINMTATFGRDFQSKITIHRYLSLFVTTVLSAVIIVGYFIVTTNFAVTEVALMLTSILSTPDEEWPRFNFAALGSLSVSFLVTIIVISLIYINFKVNLGLYYFIMALNAPVLFSCLRTFVGKAPKFGWRLKYAVVYDLLTMRDFLRNKLVLTVCCVLGYFVNVEYNTLQLLDIVFLSPIIANIIKSVTSPGTQLLLVLYLFCVSVLIYAAFGHAHFPDDLIVPDANGGEACKSILSCFYYIFYVGMNHGSIDGDLESPQPGSVKYPLRIVYDSVFYVWVGIVLNNIITGLMVDEFSRLREEQEGRSDTLESECFVCGISRNTYEDFGLVPELPNFDAHLQVDHNLWNYVYFIAYLRKKDPTEDAGIESFVRNKLDQGSLDWIPSRSSFVLEANGKTGRMKSKAEGKRDTTHISSFGAEGMTTTSSTEQGNTVSAADIHLKLDLIVAALQRSSS